MPNPIKLIKDDHEAVKGLFEAFNKLEEESLEEKKEIADQILKELTIHAKMEEKFFYSKIKDAMDAEHPVPIDEAYAEHHAAKLLMMELKLMPVGAENYDAKMTVLEENIMHHIEEEETELLPEAEKMLEGQMEEIGKEMAEYKESASKDLLDRLLGE